MLPGITTAEKDRRPSDDFKEAERLFWLDNWVKARNLYSKCEIAFAKSDPGKALICKFSRLRAEAETNLSYYTVSNIITSDLEGRTAQANPKARLRGLVIKATADLSIHDPILSGQEWEEVQSLARSLREVGWEARAKGELGIVAYLRGDTTRAVALNTESFLKEKQLNDIAGMIRALSLKGIGLLERNGADQAITYFDQALRLSAANPDVRFPLMAYMGKSAALESQGDREGAAHLLRQANEFVENIGMKVYKADLAIALGVQAEKGGHFAEAEVEFEQACNAARISHMPRPFADAMFHRIELRERKSNWKAAERLVPIALRSDRELIDIQFLPQHLAQAARIETHLGKILSAREYLSQASDLIEAALAKNPSPNIQRSLIATMSEVFVAQFNLALNQDGNLPKAFSIVENARSIVIAEHLRAANTDSAVSTARAKRLNGAIATTQLKLISSAHTPRERARLLQALDEFESELEATQVDQPAHSYLTRTLPISLATVQASLSLDELLLEYVVSDKVSYVLAVTHDSARSYKLLGSEDLASLVAKYTEEVMNSNPLPESARFQANRLFDAVLGKIKELDRRRRLIVVPDGALNGVGFDSLIDASKRYLIRTHTISYVPSATVLSVLRSRPSNSTAPYTMLAFGAPELPNRSGSRRSVNASRALLDIRDEEIPPLRSASGEVRSIASELEGSSRVFLGADATEARFKSEPLSQFRIIHFATHAFADMHHPERSAIVLTPDARSGDDGLLQIREIRSLDLRADLVTLSACNAGIGRSDGIQGLESLVSAFEFAGARSVLASRWVADDMFTATLMTDIYRELSRGVSVAESLRQAELGALQKFGTSARPALWSAFFVSGSPDITIHEQQPASHQR